MQVNWLVPVVFPVDERSFGGRERRVIGRRVFLDYAGGRFRHRNRRNWSRSSRLRFRFRGRSSVTPVRRREDTEGNRHTRVEVQLGCCSAASFLEGLGKALKKRLKGLEKEKKGREREI